MTLHQSTAAPKTAQQWHQCAKMPTPITEADKQAAEKPAKKKRKKAKR